MKTIYSSGVEAGLTINKLNVLLGKKNRKIERLKVTLTASMKVTSDMHEQLKIALKQLVAAQQELESLKSALASVPMTYPGDC